MYRSNYMHRTVVHSNQSYINMYCRKYIHHFDLQSIHLDQYRLVHNNTKFHRLFHNFQRRKSTGCILHMFRLMNKHCLHYEVIQNKYNTDIDRHSNHCYRYMYQYLCKHHCYYKAFSERYYMSCFLSTTNSLWKLKS
jgi:hypothetical protein